MVSPSRLFRFVAVVSGIAALAWGVFATKNVPYAVIAAGAVLVLFSQPWLKLRAAKVFGIEFLPVVRLEIALSTAKADSDWLATGQCAPYGEGGPTAYFYHLVVTNKGNEPAEKVRVLVTSAHKPSEGDNALAYPLRLHEANGTDRDPSSVSISGYGGQAKWNLGYLGDWDAEDPRHSVHHFQLDVYNEPLNFRPIVGRVGSGKVDSMRITVQPVADNARTEPLEIEISFDGELPKNKNDTKELKEHCKVKVLRR